MTTVKVTLNRLLFAMIGRAELVDLWWDSPNKAFDGKTPNEVYLSGEEGRQKVINYIHFHANASGGS
jgi:hypothetical protein